jgi:hypothetical protein
MNDDLQTVKMRKRGFVWILVGIGLYVYGMVSHQPVVLRGTQVPFWIILIGLGVILIGWDTLHYRKELAKAPPPIDPSP